MNGVLFDFYWPVCFVAYAFKLKYRKNLPLFEIVLLRSKGI